MDAGKNEDRNILLYQLQVAVMVQTRMPNPAEICSWVSWGPTLPGEEAQFQE